MDLQACHMVEVHIMILQVGLKKFYAEPGAEMPGPAQEQHLYGSGWYDEVVCAALR